MKSNNLTANKWLRLGKSTIYDLGVMAEVANTKECYVIKVDNHHSLFSIISKIRRTHQFTVKNYPKENKYIINILKD